MEIDVYNKKDEQIKRFAKEKLIHLFPAIGFLLFFVLLGHTSVAQTITGTVFRDFDNNGLYVAIPTSGTYSYGEPGVAGVVVYAYNTNGTLVSTATSTTTGAYSLTGLTANQPYRVEFTRPSSLTFLNDGFHVTGGIGTSIQFVTAGTANVNYGVSASVDYCQKSPPLAVPCYVSGNPLSTTATNANDHVLISVPYEAVSTAASAASAVSVTPLANADDIGSVWGLAFQRETKSLFTAAFLKRHSGLGPAGLGGIYVTNTVSTTTATYVDLENAPFNLNLGQSTIANRFLPGSATTSSTDSLAFNAVGKIGLGGMALSSNGATLYIVDLYNRQLLALAIGNPAKTSFSASDLTKITIPDPGCTNGVARPFGISIHDGKVYIGVVCTGENTGGSAANMYAYVYSMPEGGTSLTNIFSFRLNYTKGNVHSTYPALGSNWQTWTGNFNQLNDDNTGDVAANEPAGGFRRARPQPMLSSIAFADNGDMVIGFMDRAGHQLGYRQRATAPETSTTYYGGYIGGDILRAHYNGTAWVLENNATAGSLTTGGKGNGEGPGTPTSTTYTSPSGEFYLGDYYHNGTSLHEETFMGSAFVPAGYDVSVTTAMDIIVTYTGGFKWLDNTTGDIDKQAQIYASTTAAGTTFGKANGLGAIEGLCNPAPIEIGNRVWRDTNNNGIQDPGEPGLAGVRVVLTGPGLSAPVSVTTNTDGEYYFTNNTGTAATGFAYSLSLTPGGSYTLSFPTSVSSSFGLTTSNASAGSTPDAVDSDPSAAGIVTFVLGASGQNNYTYDAGYSCIPPTVTLSSATICAGQSATLVATSGFTTYSYSTGLTPVTNQPNAASITTASTAASSTTPYSVTVTNALGCSAVATGSVVVNPLPTVTLSSVTVCAGQIATLTATAGLASYAFSTGLTRVGQTNTATITAPATVATATTTPYTVTVTSAAGCSAVATGSVTVNPNPVATLSSATVCAGQTATLTATTGFSTYAFSTGLTPATGQANVATLTTLATASAGTTPYSVTVTNAVGCSSVATGFVTINALPAVTLSSATVCAGQSATLTATSGFNSYAFSAGLTRIGQTNAASITTPATAPDGTTPYSVTVTNAAGCSAVATGSVTINATPVATLSSVTVCAGQIATLTATGGFSSYAFSAGLNQVVGQTNTATLATQTGALGSTTPYSVTVTSAAGCSAVATGLVTINANPVATLSSVTVCAGQTATLTATSGFSSYVFSTGLTRVGQTNTATLTTQAGASASTTPYSVTVTNAAGCSAVANGSVTINANPVATLSSVTVCAGQTATLTATGGFSSYAFSAGLNQVVGQTNTATLTTQAGASASTTPYSVTVTNAAGCSAIATGSVTINATPVATLSSVTVCAGQTAILTATPGFNSYAFSAGLNQVVGQTNTATLTTLPTAAASTTPYSVTVTNAAGCSAIATGLVTINANPVATLSSVTVCAGQTATLTATGGFSAYQFSSGLTQTVGQTNTATLATQAGASASTTPYSVTVTNAAGCSAVASGSVTINANPVATLSSVTVCAGQTATLTATGGFSSYRFSTGLTQVVGQTNTATLTTQANAPGSTTPYSVTVTNAAGCSAVASGSVTINANPVATLSSVTVCAGQTATLTATPGFNSYAFSAGLNQVVGQTNTATLTTPTALATATTTPYSVTVTNATGCSAIATGSVTVNPNPVVTLSSVTVCAGQTAILTATPGFNSYAFSAGLNQVVGQTNTATLATPATVVTATTTPYSVTVTNAAGCSAVATGSVTVNPNPVVTLSSTTICAGQTTTLRATNGFSTYAFSAGLTQVGQGNTATLTSAATAPAGTTPYSVTVTSAAGCSAIATGSVTINATPVATLSSVTVCAGQTATLTATGGFSSYAFSAGLNQVVGQTNTATLTTLPTAAASTTPYSVTVTNAAGCSAIATGSVTINPTPTVTLNSVTVCAGQTATLTATPGLASYQFSAGLTPVNGQTNAATLTTLATAAASTNPYSVTVTNASGCSAVATGSITINPLPTATLSSVTLCTGQTAILTASSGYATYQFSAGLTPVAGQPNTASTTTAGNYSVIITSAAGCSSTAVGSVTYNNTPVVTFSSVTVCAGQTATLTATPGFNSYAFSAGLTQIPGQPNVATAATAGTYSVTATSNASCVGSATATVTITPNPIVSLSSATVCAGQTATLTATGGFSSYAFSAGLNQIAGQTNTATLTTLATDGASTTPYSVTVTNVAGCTAVANSSITVNPNPVATLSSVTVCAGQTATLTATPGFSSYAFSAGLNQVVGQTNTASITTPATVAVATTTPYSVTVTNAAGCSAVATGSITVNPNPAVTLSTVTVCAGQTATLRATNGFSTYAFSAGLTLSATQANVATITTLATAPAATTPYSVTVTNAAGCSAIATGSVTVNPIPTVTLNSVTVCAGQTATLTATPGLAAYQFSADLTPATGQANVATLATVATAAASTTPYSVTVTNASGCSAVATGSITINPNPVVTLSSTTVCAGQTATLTATGGLASYAFSAGLNQVVGQTNTATISTSATASAATTPYSVTVTNAAGCSAIATGSVTVNANPVVTLSSATVCAGQTATLTATPGLASYQFSAGLTPANGQANAATLTTLTTASASTTPYSVTVTNAAGCSAVATGSITINNNPVVALSSATVCAGQTAILTATGGFNSYLFSSGLTSVSGQANAAALTTLATASGSTTPYSVTVSSGAGCSAVATGSITVNPTPTVTLSSVTVCAGQTATLTATPGFNSYAFSTGLTEVVGQTNTATLNTPATLASATTTPYSVTVTNAAGCSAIATGSITVNPNPVVTLSSATVCAGQTATLRTTAGFSTYAFSTGLTQTGQVNTAIVTTLATATAGTTPYSVTVTNAAGCSAVTTGSVTINATPVVTLSSVTVCAGQTATLTATPGLASYQFSAGLNQVVGQTNTATLTTLATTSAGTTPYSVTVTSAAGCSAIATGSVTVNANPVVTLSSATVCAGQTATLTATGGFASYQFSTDLTPASGQANAATLTTLATAAASTTPYSVTVTNATGCSAIATGSVTVNPNPVVTLSSVTVCAGQTATLAATSGFSAYVFSTGLTQAAGQPNTATLTTLANASDGTTPYSVTVTNAIGCSAVATGTVTINATPVVTLSSATICAGQTATLAATGGFGSYQFSAGLNQVVGQTNTATLATPASLASATTTPYSVTVTNGTGCSAVATGSITVNPNPVVTLSSATVCAGQTATLTATGGFSTYAFATGLTPATGQANAATLTTLATASAGTTPYSVTVTNALGCSAVATGSVTVNPNPVVTLTSITVCAGQTVSLTATPGFSSYAFSAGLNQVVGQINTATLTTLATASGSTTPYSVTVTSAAGCSAVATGSVTVNPNPVVTLSSVTVCAGQTASLTATPGFASYQFSADLISTNVQPNVAALATVATFSTTTTPYSVTVTNATGCSAVATGSITVNPNPTVTLSSVTVCAGQTASLTATSGFSSYQFSTGLTPISGQVNVATGTTEGTYSVTAISSDGCVSTATGTINVNATPVITLSSVTVCSGQTASLTVTPGFASYQFSAGLTQVGTTNVATTTNSGSYSVLVTDANGCSATATASVVVNNNPVIALSSATICAGQTASLTATSGFASYQFSGGLTAVVGQPNTATGTVAGTYSVTVTSDAGCSSTATGGITVNPNPVVTLSSATICSGQTASLTATPGYASYQFSTGVTQIAGQPNVVTGTTSGTYSVTATSTGGCSSTATGSITVSPNVVVTLSSATICAGQTGVLTATAGYSTYIFSTGLTQAGSSNVASTTVAGTYSVTAISNAGCSGTATATLVVNPTAVVTLSSATICAGQSATLTATAGFANYAFSAGVTPVPGTPNVAIGTVAGTYSVTATSNATCIGSATATITVNPVPVASLTVSSATLCQGQSATLTASGGTTYLWSTNEQTPSIVVTAGGVYSVTVISAGGCTDVASTTITVNPLPVLTINSATICSGQSASLTVGGCDGGTIQWSTGASTATILVTPTLPTTYSVTCTFPTGCSSATATSVTVNSIPTFSTNPQAFTASCTGATANNDARIVLTGLQNTERVDIVLGNTYGNGPAYGATTNRLVSGGTISFTNLPNPAASQPYTIRLFNPGGTCYVDVTVILEPAFCNCPPAKCVPFVIKKTQTGRTALR